MDYTLFVTFLIHFLLVGSLDREIKGSSSNKHCRHGSWSQGCAEKELHKIEESKDEEQRHTEVEELDQER